MMDVVSMVDIDVTGTVGEEPESTLVLAQISKTRNPLYIDSVVLGQGKTKIPCDSSHWEIRPSFRNPRGSPPLSSNASFMKERGTETRKPNQ